MLMTSCLLAFEHHIKPILFGSSLICIVNCICLLILYLVLDILVNAQVELGAYLLFQPHHLSCHHLIIPPSKLYMGNCIHLVFMSSPYVARWIHFYLYVLPYMIYIVLTIWIMWSHMATFASYVSIIPCQASTWVLFEYMLMHEYILWLFVI